MKSFHFILFQLAFAATGIFFSVFPAGAQTVKEDTAYVDQLYNASKKYWWVNSDSAILYLRQSEELSDKLHYKRGKAYSLYGYGVVDQVLYKQFQYFTLSLELFQEINDPFGIGLNLIKVGKIYTQIGEPEKSLMYYQQALTVKKTVNDFGGIALTLIEIGYYYQNKNKLDDALRCYEESLTYRRKVGAHQGIAYSFANMASIRVLKNDVALALTLADSAIYHFSFTNDAAGKIFALNAKGNSLLKAHRDNEAEAAFLTICALPSNNSSQAIPLYAKKVLTDFAVRRGDLRRAVALQSEYIAVKELSDKQDYRSETQRLANEFEFRNAALKESHEKQLAAQQLNRRNNLENLIIAAIVMVVFVLLFSSRKKIPAFMADAVIFIALLLLFEFLLVLTDDSVEAVTRGEPILKLLSNVVLALLILPVHRILEKFIHKKVLKVAG